MSKNKIIKFMHDETGLSYKECRKRLKENNWNLLRAMGYGEALEKIVSLTQELSKSLASAINAMVDSCRQLALAVADAISKTDLQAIIEQAEQLQEENSNGIGL